MVEIFKTNVKEPSEAAWISNQINRIFADYKINFDLDDCDRIMRVQCDKATIDSENIILLLNSSGFKTEILEDDFVVNQSQK